MNTRTNPDSMKGAYIGVFLFLIGLNFYTASAQSDITTHKVIIEMIKLSGNKKTLDYILYRELNFSVGDTIPSDVLAAKISQSRLNLLNTSLFNFVSIDTALLNRIDTYQALRVNITVLERWYIWPAPILKIIDRNLNIWFETHDYTRVVFGLDVKWHNFTGRMDELDAIAQIGKNYQYSLTYLDPYIDKKMHLGLGFDAGYRKNRETGFVTQEDKLKFAFRTDGLSTEKFFTIKTFYRKDIFVTYQLDIGLQSFSFADTLVKLNQDYSYKDLKGPEFFHLYYKLKIDHRDIKYYTLKGWYADIELSKQGFGANFEKSVNVLWIKTTMRLFSQIGQNWFTGISLVGKLSSDKWQPYFLMQGLGYDRDYVRGYEYQVIDGMHYGLFRSTIKYALIPEKIRNINFVRTPKFGHIHYALYMTAFTDLAYVWQPQWTRQNNNVLPQTLLVGTGVGADLVTYYDKVFRLEYSVNKIGKSGIFIHFISGI